MFLLSQGNFLEWKANSEAFGSLSSLQGLTRLSLHAFHAAHVALSSALPQLTGLRHLSLSGRVLLNPLSALSSLRGLQHLDLTQDVALTELGSLLGQLTELTHLHVGRIICWDRSPGGVAPQAVAGAAAGAGGAGAGAGGGVAAALAGAAAAAADQHDGENLLDDLGAIVDGLIMNLQVRGRGRA